MNPENNRAQGTREEQPLGEAQIAMLPACEQNESRLLH